MLVALPRILSNAEVAGQAREMASRYGGVLGDLDDLDQAAGAVDQAAALAIVTEFEATKQKKDSQRRLPDRKKVQIRKGAELSRMEHGRGG